MDFTHPVYESFRRQPEAFQTSFEKFLIPGWRSTTPCTTWGRRPPR